MELDTAALTATELTALEAAVNRAVREGQAVTVTNYKDRSDPGLTQVRGGGGGGGVGGGGREEGEGGRAVNRAVREGQAVTVTNYKDRIDPGLTQARGGGGREREGGGGEDGGRAVNQAVRVG